MTRKIFYIVATAWVLAFIWQTCAHARSWEVTTLLKYCQKQNGGQNDASKACVQSYWDKTNMDVVNAVHGIMCEEDGKNMGKTWDALEDYVARCMQDMNKRLM